MVAMNYNLRVTLALLTLLASLARAGSPVPPEVRVLGRGLMQGEAALIVVSRHDPKTAPKGSFLDKDLVFSPGRAAGTWVAVAAVDLMRSTGTSKLALTMTGTDGAAYSGDRDVDVAYKAFKTRELTVDPKFVEPPKDLAERAKREGARLDAIYETRTPDALWDGAFSSPIPGAVVSRFGERSVFNGVPKAPHAGADLRAKKGVPVRAAARGRVVLAEEFFYPGNIVVLDHGWGVYSSYSHLSRIDVREGDLVPARRILGLVGATGRVTGPHLHWAVKVSNARVDPFSLVALPLDQYR